MRPVTPDSNVANLNAAIDAREEVSLIVPVADDGVFEVQTLTMPTVAAATTGDFFIVENKAGQKMAVWLDKAGTNSPPSGTLYTAANVKVRANVSTDTTAIQVAARVIAAMTAGSPIANLTRTDNLDGTITFTATKLGNVTAPAVHNAAENAAGSITAATTTGGVASSAQSTYVQFRKGDNTKYHVWFNVNSEGADPAPSASTGIEVDVPQGSTAAAIAALIVAAVNLDATFAANLYETAKVAVHAPDSGDPTDISAGTSPYTVSVFMQGASKGSACLNAADSPDGISNNPSVIT